MSENPGSQLPAEQRSLLDQGPARWPEALTATGDAGVDQALGVLDLLPEAPTAAHPELYEQVYETLLAELEAGPEETGLEN